jgi:hypothetical protein
VKFILAPGLHVCSDSVQDGAFKSVYETCRATGFYPAVARGEPVKWTAILPDRFAPEHWAARTQRETPFVSARHRRYLTHEDLDVLVAPVRSDPSAASPPRRPDQPANNTNGRPLSDESSGDVPAKRTGGRPPNTRPGNVERPITRSYVAFVLRVDVSTVRRLESRGELHPEIGAGGIRYFDLHELLALKSRRIRMARARTADISLAAFELFRHGVDWRDVAIRLRYDPFRIHRLWRLYAVDERVGAVDDTDN